MLKRETKLNCLERSTLQYQYLCRIIRTRVAWGGKNNSEQSHVALEIEKAKILLLKYKYIYRLRF